MRLNASITKGKTIDGTISGVFVNVREQIEENTKARHTHTNKNALDKISEEDVIKWNNGSEKAINAMEVWKPKTAYEVGDIRIAESAFGGFEIIRCKESHISSNADYYDYADTTRWDIQKYTNARYADNARSATYDIFGNTITETYLSSEDANETYLSKEEAKNSYVKIKKIDIIHAYGEFVSESFLPTFNELVSLTQMGDDKYILYVTLTVVDEKGSTYSTGHMGFDSVRFCYIAELIGDNGVLYRLTLDSEDGWSLTPLELSGGGSVEIDDTPTEGSTNAVSSGGVYTVLGDIETALDEIIEIQESLISGDSTTESGGGMEWA